MNRPARERRVLAKLVARCADNRRGIFELADGGRVKLDGVITFDDPRAPTDGEKAFVVVDTGGRAVRWEPYDGARLRRRKE